MTTKRMFSIITIACFVSILFIPIGIVLMIFYTGWKKKIKIILSSIFTLVYLVLAFFLFNLKPNQNSKGLTLPININGTESVNTNTAPNPDEFELPEIEEPNSKKSKKDKSSKIPEEKLPKSVSRKTDFFTSRGFYTILFFLFMLFLIIHQNLKSKKKQIYENPYVDTNKYKLPLDSDSKLPMVHFTKIRIGQNEKILFATETTKKEEEGDFVVTNKRVVVLSKAGDYEFPLPSITAVSSVSNTVMLLTCGERKYYIFFPEGQLKYALAVVRWAYSNKQ